uniref:R13L1/DRL21-like LRR repeat region domain-containing protein n=1 Tax=Oryza meridionalis TaxID=40149 RepID=A0A0E0F3L4_9ORYZ
METQDLLTRVQIQGSYISVEELLRARSLSCFSSPRIWEIHHHSYSTHNSLNHGFSHIEHGYCTHSSLDQGFFEPFASAISTTTAGMDHQNVALFTMHDLVHDLARSVMVDEILVSSKQDNNSESSYRYALLNDSSKPLKSFTEFHTKLRALRFVDCTKAGLRDDAFSGCSGIQRVPQSFGKLKLSYLDLSNCSSLKGVSEYLGNLSKLQHLDLSYCQYVEKLGNLGSLTELQYFHFSTSSCSPGLSQTDVLGTFTKLEYLNLSTEFTDIKIKRLPDAMGNFIKLEYLDLSGWRELEELPKSWGSLKNLIHLDLSKCFKIKGCLNTLQEGEIEAEVVCQNFLASVCSLSNLEELDLSHNYRIKTLPESTGDLRKLHTLTLRRCLGLSQLPRALREIDNLKHLNIADCFLDMSTVPKSNSSLILLPRFAVQALDDGSGSNLVLLQNVNRATTLEINKLENVVTVREAQRVRLKEKEMILELALCWTSYARRLLDDQILLGELEPPRNLSKFQLRFYNSVAFPDWLMNIAPHHFPSLSRIYLVDLPKCTCLPPLGQLPQLEILSLDGMNGITKIDGEFCGGAGAFPSLKNLYISNMESLEEWQTKYSCSEGGGVRELMSPMMKLLKIDHCPS